MAEDQTTQPATNTEAARTADGTLKDQGTSTITTETKTADTSVTDDKGGTTLLTEADDKPKTEDKTEKKDEKTGAPEKYEPFTAPEGHTFTSESVEEASALFKELGLNQAQAQKLMDTYAAKALAAGEANAAAYKAMREGWQAEVKADPEIGKILPAVKATIGRALDSLGDPALATSFKASMDLTGAGDHPAFVKTFYKLAQAVVEGGHVKGAGPSALGQTPSGKVERPSLAQAMYPNRTAS